MTRITRDRQSHILITGVGMGKNALEALRERLILNGISQMTLKNSGFDLDLLNATH